MTAIAQTTVRRIIRFKMYLLRAAYRRPWVVSLWAVVLTFLAVTMVVSVRVGIPIRDPEGTLLGKRIVLPLVFMGIFFAIDVIRRARVVWRRGRVRARDAIVDVFIERWWWQRIALAIIGFLAFHATYLGYRNMKSWVRFIDPKVYDPELMRLDRWMAFGHDPSVVLHHVFGTGIAAHVLSSIYLAFLPFVPISVAAALTFVDRMRDGYVFVAASVYCWILGTASYYLIPSQGPFGQSRAVGGKSSLFTDLPNTGVAQLQQALTDQRLSLSHDPIGSDLVQSIGGFASLHIGIVFMALLMTRYYRHRILEMCAWAFLIPTLIATIYFGWHYILDDLAGFAIGAMAVTWARWTIYPRAIPVVRMVQDRRVRKAESVTAVP